MNLTQLQNKVRELSEICKKVQPDFGPFVVDGFKIKLQGFGHSKLLLAVHKETEPVHFGSDQASFMMFLGDHVCPKILIMDNNSYVMEYLHPAIPHERSLRDIELFLGVYVWKRSFEDVPFAKLVGDEDWKNELAESIGLIVPEWALDTPCVIHGDPTLDNTLITKENHIRIADPIPPHWLVRPSIRAVDHGKILQSFLGWERVLRGIPKVDFILPNFMEEYETARRAIFWCIVALKRIALRNNTSHAGQWAATIAEELGKCEL